MLLKNQGDPALFNSQIDPAGTVKESLPIQQDATAVRSDKASQQVDQG